MGIYIGQQRLNYLWEKIKTIITNKEKVIAAALNDLEKRKANASELAAVATSGSYEDLDGKPSLGVQSVNEETGDVILNIEDINDSDWDYIFADERDVGYIWIDDWPEDSMQDIIETVGTQAGNTFNCEADYFQYVINNCSDNPSLANQYHNTGETFEYNGESYLLFESESEGVNGVSYGLVAPITYSQLFEHTIEHDLGNLSGDDWSQWNYSDRQPYCPFAYFLDSDMKITYTVTANLANRWDLITIGKA